MIDRLSIPVNSSHQRTPNTEGNMISIPKEVPQEDNKELNLQDRNPNKKEKVEEVVESLNSFLQATHTSLKFEFHEKLNEYYVKVVDDKTHETIREIPSKKMLDFYAAMTEFVGLMVDKKI
jgi:flagellar protein FlaG